MKTGDAREIRFHGRLLDCVKPGRLESGRSSLERYPLFTVLERVPSQRR